MQLTLGHDDASAANTDLLPVHGDLDSARAADLVPLLDDDRRPIGDDSPCHELAGQRGGRTPRRRVFPDANGRVEKARVRDRLGLNRIEGVEVATLACNLAKGGGQPGRVRSRAINDAAAGRLNEEMSSARGDDLRLLIPGVEPERRRQLR
jgi:hypothetical protein